VVGFGTFHYKSASGQEGDWFPVGFASRKAAITIYLGLSLDESTELLARLGKHTTGKGCIYVKRLANVDLAVLQELVADSYARIRRAYG
jgi:predicted GIY-YIG superfamily endonuclease